jgi:hypothetical protein
MSDFRLFTGRCAATRFHYLFDPLSIHCKVENEHNMDRSAKIKKTNDIPECVVSLRDRLKLIFPELTTTRITCQIIKMLSQ